MEFNGATLEGIIIGVAGSLIAAGIILLASKYYKKFQKSRMLSDIEMLTYEKEHLEEMKRSSVQMSRSSFRAIFAVLIMFSIGGGVPHFAEFLHSEGTAFYSLLSVFVWSSAGGVSYKYFRRFNDLNSMKSALARIDGKLEKLNSKL